MTTSYKQHFAGTTEAENYDREVYATNSYSSLLWELEKAELGLLLGKIRQTHAHVGYLDFAAGTGRVSAFLETLVDKATAIEISPSMAARAGRRLCATQVLCRDITAEGAAVEDKYDLITAFRFFLNAEPNLRWAAMRALASRLRDESSLLVFNNHGNLWSLKILGWPYHRLRSAQKGWQPQGNYLRHSQVRRLLEDAGLRIVKVIGLGVLGGKIAARMPSERALRLERWFSANPFCSKFGQDQIYVVCLNRKASGNVPSRTEV
jgi:SAM-dependent methyltransferase